MLDTLTHRAYPGRPSRPANDNDAKCYRSAARHAAGRERSCADTPKLDTPRRTAARPDTPAPPRLLQRVFFKRSL